MTSVRDALNAAIRALNTLADPYTAVDVAAEADLDGTIAALTQLRNTPADPRGYILGIVGTVTVWDAESAILSINPANLTDPLA